MFKDDDAKRATELNGLLERARNGDRAARDKAIEINAQMVESLAREAVRKCPAISGHADDLIGAGNVALVKAVDYLLREDRERAAEPLAYLITSIKRAINHYGLESDLVGACSSTQARAHSLGVKAPTFRQADSELVNYQQASEDRTALIDLRDAIDACCESKLEREIVALRAEGQVDDAIAETLNVSSATVHRHRKAIEARFNEHCLALSA